MMGGTKAEGGMCREKASVYMFELIAERKGEHEDIHNVIHSAYLYSTVYLIICTVTTNNRESSGSR